MKTSEKIKRGLECDCCADCPYSSVENGCTWSDDYALAYIQQLEVDSARQDAYILRLENELEAVKRERDAVIELLRGACTLCKNNKLENADDLCFRCKWGYGCTSGDFWEYDGVCPENTEAQEDGYDH